MLVFLNFGFMEEIELGRVVREASLSFWSFCTFINCGCCT